MKPITKEALSFICPNVKNAADWASLMDGVLPSYDLNTVNRQAMFLAQVLHETGGFKYLKEIWGPTKWQLKYENNASLGNDQPGDGKKYLGRGLIQLTGKANYVKFNNWLLQNNIRDDVVNNPDLVCNDISIALLAAIWFWNNKKLNQFADKDDIAGCTKVVNGPGMLGLQERIRYYERGKVILT